MPFTLFPRETPPDANALAEVAADLRAESEAAESEASRGILMYEVGVIEDLARSEGQAARELLGAVNALPEHHEPLERLVALIERRKSYKNLGKLVDRLAKIGETPEEIARSLVALGEFREDHEGDLASARDAFERATAAEPGSTEAWLALERVVARQGDTEARLRALAARIEAATDPTWRALLWLDLAALRVAAGKTESALEGIEQALAVPNGATYVALGQLLELGRNTGRGDLACRALEARADLSLRAARLDEGGAGAGGAPDPALISVPEERRSVAHAAACWLEAGELWEKSGDTARARALYQRAAEHLPAEVVAVCARLRSAEAAGETAEAADLARAELERGAKGKLGAGLQMRIAEAAAASGDAAAALSALSAALSEDPACIPARTLQLHLLSAGDPAALAQALEAAAAQCGSEAFAADMFLLAADTWVRGAGDVSAAKVALSQAAASGAALDIVARTARLLATASGDPAWFDEATRRLLTTAPPDEEQASLWFEAGRGRLLRGEGLPALEAFTALAAAPGGAWLGNALIAYALPDVLEGETDGARSGAALEALGSLAAGTDLGPAFGIAAALRHLVRGAAERARSRLTALHEADPKDLVSGGALAALHRREGHFTEAAAVLTRLGEALVDDALGVAALLEAGIVLWLGSDRTGAIERFELARGRSPESASSLLAWALRAAEPDDPAARLRALEAAGSQEHPGVVALERFGLAAGKGRAPEAPVASQAAATKEDGAIGAALDLARLLVVPSGELAGSAAEEAVAARSPAARATVWGATHFARLREASPDAKSAMDSAARWVGVTDDAPAALEWLALSIAARDVPSELAAREQLAERTAPDLRATLLASARLVGRIASDVDAPLLSGTEDDTLLTNLELAPPSCDPRRRAAALIDGARVLDETSRVSALSLGGWNLLAAGDAAGAILAFRSGVEQAPDDMVSWEGLRAAAELKGDKATLAEASAALGDLTSDPGQGGELWERAGLILLELGDAARGEAALARAVERDIGRSTAFDRLFRMVRSRKDGARLMDLVSARLEVAEDPAEIAKLYWERARVLRESGDGHGAIEALENVTMLEPDHVGALALTGEIYISEKRFAEAAESLARLARLTDAPLQQRLMSGMAATDLYENRLGEPVKGLEVLEDLHRAGLATLPVRERLARAAARTEAWDTATTVLEELMVQRESRDGRVEAARLAMVLYRDRLEKPRAAEGAVERLLSEAPHDGEALDLVLSDVFPKPLTTRLLQKGREATQARLVEEPLDLERMQRLAEIARHLGDVQLRQVTLGAVAALGGVTTEILAELDGLERRVARTPQIAVDDRVVQSLRDPDDQGPIAELFQVMAGTITLAIGPGLTAFGVGKKERVRPQDGLPIRNEVAAWVGALGLGEFELYVGGREPRGIHAIATETPSIIVGDQVPCPLGANERQALARELLALRLGTNVLGHRDTSDITALVVAACRIGGHELAGPPYAMVGEFERLLSKEIPRRVKKMLPDITASIAGAGLEPARFVAAAQSSLDRMATIATGDVSFVLASLVGGRRGEAPATTEGRARAARLLSFVLSDTFFGVREKLGMGVR